MLIQKQKIMKMLKDSFMKYFLKLDNKNKKFLFLIVTQDYDK